MNRKMRRFLERKLHLINVTRAKVDEWIYSAMAIAAASGYNLAKARSMVHSQTGSLSVETIIMIFVAIIIIYQLIPQISSDNNTVQNTANVSGMAKFAAGLGEWLFPLLGVIAVVFLLFRRKKGGSIG